MSLSDDLEPVEELDDLLERGAVVLDLLAGLAADAIAPNQTITSVTAAPAREAGEKIEDDGTAFEKVVEFLDGLKVI